MVLASHRPGLESQSPVDTSAGRQPPRQPSALHCGYVVAEDGATVALACTDSAGELAHGELLDCDCDRGVNSGCEEELCDDVLEATMRVRSTRRLFRCPLASCLAALPMYHLCANLMHGQKGGHSGVKWTPCIIATG